MMRASLWAVAVMALEAQSRAGLTDGVMAPEMK